MKVSDYNDIGRYLKDSRESLHASASDVAHALNVRTHYIEAIEQGDFSKLPGKAYVRGYIKNYALYLGIDPEEVLSSYDALSIKVKQPLYIPEPTVKENLPSKALMNMAIGAAVLLLVYYAFFRQGERVVIPQVADVPAAILFEAYSADPRVATWKACLNSDAPLCYNFLYSQEITENLDKERLETFTFLSDM